MTKKDKIYFTEKLLAWNSDENKRQMPWKGETNPYKIWLSEIILQQTRVEQGWDYYARFTKAYPTIAKLAKAPEQEIFKLWEGLGYYTRCKNLIATAKFIAGEKNGKFPDTYDEILKLKGVGPYTAAAIGSFAFNLPHAVVDGNVFRVLARFFGIDTAIDSTTGKKNITALAEQLLEKSKPGIYNQAIMDFGAVICKPKNPLCSSCPLNKNCAALKLNLVNQLPVKAGKLVKKTRWLYYFVLQYEGKTYVRKRPAKDIWENLYEFVLLEKESMLNEALLKKSVFLKDADNIAISKQYRQQLTHQTIHGRFVYARIKSPFLPKGYTAVGPAALKKLPFPKFITAWLAENNQPIFDR